MRVILIMIFVVSGYGVSAQSNVDRAIAELGLAFRTELTALRDSVRILRAELSTKENTLPYRWFGTSFYGMGTDSLNAIEAIVPRVTKAKRDALTNQAIVLVFQTDNVIGLYLRRPEGWTLVK